MKKRSFMSREKGQGRKRRSREGDIRGTRAYPISKSHTAIRIKIACAVVTLHIIYLESRADFLSRARDGKIARLEKVGGGIGDGGWGATPRTVDVEVEVERMVEVVVDFIVVDSQAERLVYGTS